MRKALTCTILLLVLAVGGICLTARTVFAAHDQVTYTETLREGSPSAANGAVVSLGMQYDYRLFWDTVFKAGSAPLSETQHVQTQYTCHLTQYYSRLEPSYNGVTLQNSYDNGVSYFDTDGRIADVSPLAAAYDALYDKTAPGKEGKLTVLVQDYYEYYPISGQIHLPGCSIELTDAVAPEYVGISPYATAEQWNDFQSFFRIPVLPDEKLELTLGRDESGRVWHYGRNGVDGGDGFGLYTYSAITADSCYFTFDCHTFSGKLVDTSLIPGGYGLYRLPYTTNDDGTTEPQTGALEMVCPLDPDAELCGMRLDPTGTRLLLFTVKNDAYILTVIDLRSMQQLQQLPICELGENSVIQNYDGGDFFTVLCGNGSFTLLQAQLDGSYTPALSGQLPLEALGSGLYQSFDMDYDGTRLAVVSLLNDDTYAYRIYGFSLCICDADGLRFWGEYRSSLAAGFDPDDSYHYLCHLAADDALRVRWTNET